MLEEHDLRNQLKFSGKNPHQPYSMCTDKMWSDKSSSAQMLETHQQSIHSETSSKKLSFDMIA